MVHEHAVKVFETQELVALQVDTLLDGLTDEEVQSRELALNTRLKTLIAALPQIQDVWVSTKTGTLSSPEPSSPRPERWIFPIASTSASSGMIIIRPGETYVSDVLRGRAQNIILFSTLAPALARR